MRGKLSIAHELTVSASLLRPEVVTENLVETLQTDCSRLFFLVIANLRSAPATLNQKVLLSFSSSLAHLYLFTLVSFGKLRRGTLRVDKREVKS